MNSNTDTTKNLIAGGFLSGFVEVNVEKPADGLNGECIVHYGGKYSQYRMKVPIVNGIRNGMALIDNNGTPYIKLEYRNEEVTGNVERMDINGHVVLRGSLVSGMEKGLFEEYDGNMDVKWKGYYRNGERFSVVMKSQRMKGYYEEILEADGSLLSIAQYDDGLNDKKGHCMEYENGKWIGEWVYENGVKVKSICEDRNEILIRYDENGRGRNVEEWERILVLLSNRINPNIHFHPDSMMVYDIGSEQAYGMMEWNEKCFVIDWLNNVNRVTMIDLIKNEMIVYENGEEVRMNCVDDVIDLNVNGERWEGYVKNGKPFGYGVMYDEEGRKEYEGFMMDGMKNGRGIEYYSDIGRVKYDGCLCKDNHNGRGILYNRNGLVEHDGLWKNGKPYCNQFDGLTIDNHTESIGIVNNSFNEVKSFVPPFFLHSLKRIVIGDDCFERVRLFELNGLIELESVVIGEESITILKDLCGYSCFKEVDGCFRIVSCPILKSIQIGDYSFGDYRLFELNNLPSLQSIDIGYCCFYWIPSLSLTGLISCLANRYRLSSTAINQTC